MDRARFLLLLSLVLLSGLALRLHRLGVPSGYYFDEVYSAYTAEAYLHGEKGAYSPWTAHPEGVAYQWVHPPLAGLLMASGMKVSGETAFGWRLGSALAGTATIALTALLAMELFSSPAGALLAAFFLSVDGLSFAQSRIATNDVYFAAFALLAVWAWVRWKKDAKSLGKLFLAGLSLGLAVSTKWTGASLYLIFAADLCVERLSGRGTARDASALPSPAGMFFFLAALPALVYIASYTQFFVLGGGLREFLSIQWEMWRYHTGLAATHSFASTPIQWLLNLKPIWFYVDRSVPGFEGNIYNTGNSVVYFSGLAAAAAALFRPAERRTLRLPLLAWTLMWLPWLFSPRVAFFYHYTPAVPFLCVILGRAAGGLLGDGPGVPGISAGRGRAAVYLLAVLAFAWFAVFYPFHTAVQLPLPLPGMLPLARPG